VKRYRFAVRWGEQRDTDDTEGAVTATSPQRPTAAQIAAILPRFSGTIEQIPPVYSAIKVDGRRAYALARAQQAPALGARPVMVESIALIEIADADHAVFEVVAGKGVYMRALARDLAVALGTLGHVAWLRRLSVGPFSETQAVALARIEDAPGPEELLPLLLPVNAALAGMPSLSLTTAEARRLQRGQAVAALPVARRAAWSGITGGAMVCAMAEGRPVALAQIRGGEIRPVRVLNLEQ
jgi:tRNA pseudouridine55 synthase